jgi:adenylate cyclase
VKWLLGYPNQALEAAHKALDFSKRFTHPAALAHPAYWLAILHQMRRDAHAMRLHAEETRRINSQHPLPIWQGWDTCLLGWAEGVQGQESAGIERILHGLDEMQARRGRFLRPYFLALLADLYERSGQLDQGLQTVDAAIAEAEQSGERWWTAEMHRLQGDLLQRQGADDAAERSYLRAIEIAQQQQARSLELRATTALCRLWQRQGKNAQAYRVLSELYGWFTEGFETHDLRAAQELLQQLS